MGPSKRKLAYKKLFKSSIDGKFINSEQIELESKAFVKAMTLTEPALSQIKQFLMNSLSPFAIVQDSGLKNLGRIVRLHCGSDATIKTVCKKGANFSGRKIVKPGDSKLTLVADMVGEKIRYDLQSCSGGEYEVSSVSHILTQNPGDQDAHMDNHICERRYSSY